MKFESTYNEMFKGWGPDFTGHAIISHITDQCAVLLVKIQGANWDQFREAPERITLPEVGVFEKRSKVHDGLMYISGNTELRTEPTFQQTVQEWTRRVFASQQPHQIALRVLEEAVELCASVGCTKEEIATSMGKKSHLARAAFPTEGGSIQLNWAEVGDEVADVTHCLIDLLAVNHMDIEVETLKKLAINKERLWAKEKDGQIRHVESVEVQDVSS